MVGEWVEEETRLQFPSVNRHCCHSHSAALGYDRTRLGAVTFSHSPFKGAPRRHSLPPVGLPATWGPRQRSYVYIIIDSQPCINLAPWCSGAYRIYEQLSSQNQPPHFQRTALPCSCSVLSHENARSCVPEHRNSMRDFFFKPVF